MFWAPVGRATLGTGFSAQKASFSVIYKDYATSFRLNGVFLLPGETIELSAMPHRNNPYQFSASAGAWQSRAENAWLWKAPAAAGFHQVSIKDPSTNETIEFNVFVMVPASKVKNGVLNGYKIGTYPKTPANFSEKYVAPRGFVEVTQANKNTYVSPHFKLGQFLCKQEGSYPKYVVLDELLLQKLESILLEVNSHGIGCPTLTVMSGYRTPHYNHVLDNARYSRHMWGDAADVYVDESPRDGIMDDLNGDGHYDQRDSKYLAQLVEKMSRKADKKLSGGLGVYRPTKAHGPFVHVDTRGQDARW
jgi:hypothetical protein